MDVSIRENKIYIHHMNHPSCVTSFIRCMKTAARRKLDHVEVVFCFDKKTVFPNACLPISVLISRSKELFGVDCIVENYPKYLEKCNFNKPLYLKSEEIDNLSDPLDKIIMYSAVEDDGSQVASIVQRIVDYMSGAIECEPGVLDGLIWCINEVMDNVLIHSFNEYGYIMAQLHRKKKVLAICVCDTGIGIYESLMKSEKHKPQSETDAITLALQEGVGDGLGQGNGLYGLFQIVKENGGSLSITSGSSSIMLKDGEIQHFEKRSFISNTAKGTIVDFQLNLSNKIDIKDSLKSIGGFDGFDIRIDNMIQDDNTYVYDVLSNSTGTGTRKAGEKLRNDVVNIIKRTNSAIVLDFTSVQACSSSFIDEFIAKMVFEMGVIKFNDFIKIKGMNDTVRYICERSIAMRMHQGWEEISKS